MDNIKTNRLILTPVNLSHVKDIFLNFTDEVTQYMYPKPAQKIEETKNIVINFISQRLQKNDYVFSIIRNEEFLGLVGLHQLKDSIPEVGIWTKISARGYHYGREAVGGILEFSKKCGYNKLFYPVDTRNIASKKIALFYQGILRDENTKMSCSGKALFLENYIISLNKN